MTQKIITTEDASTNVIAFPQTPRPAKDQAMAGVVNRGELTSIKALTNFIAHKRNVPEHVVRDYLLAEFKAADVTDLKRAEYERVIRFLVDLQLDLIIN